MVAAAVVVVAALVVVVVAIVVVVVVGVGVVVVGIVTVVVGCDGAVVAGTVLVEVGWVGGEDPKAKVVVVDGFPDEASVDDAGATVTEVGPFTTTKPGSSEVEVDSPGTDPVEETPALPVSTERPSTSPASAGPSLGGPIPPAAHATPTPASTTTVERARRRRAIPSSDGRKRRRLDPPPSDSAIRAATRLASAWGLRRSRRGSSGTVSFSSSRPAGPKIRPRSLRVNDSPWSRRAGRVDRPGSPVRFMSGGDLYR